MYVSLYIMTWIGGWLTFAREEQDAAQTAYDRLRRINETTLKDFAARIDLHEGGPKASVKFCIPIVPGVLLADSYTSIGPLTGDGGVKVVLYYGWGTAILLELWGWIS